MCSYVVNELMQTEKLYVEDLAQIVLVCIIFLSISMREFFFIFVGIF